jgi:hypothetical protein
MEIRALRPADNRSVLQPGGEALDRFFARHAGQNRFSLVALRRLDYTPSHLGVVAQKVG